MPPSTPIDTIHVIFKTHLDVGFTDLPHKVVQKYFDEYIPGAIQTARQLREENSPDRYIWTTGSWLIYEYLEHFDGQRLKLLEDAIQAGDITWHALPFTPYVEMTDASLFRFSLELSQELDRRFGKTTIAAKMTDVPGFTRAAIRPLAEAGVRFFHIGVNPACPVPAVPPVCVWKDPSGADIILAYHGTYGELLTVPGLSHALAFAFTNDNLGPHSPADVQQIFAELRQQYPGARVIASTLDAFALQIQTVKDTLPVLTEEIGCSWIHGLGSDPTKVSAFRELMRLRAGWEQAGRIDPQDEGFKAFSRKLLAVSEHTWGLDEKTHLAEYQTFNPEQIAQALQRPNFQMMESSWQEERAYLTQAVDALQDSALQSEAERALEQIKPCRPVLEGYQPVDDFHTRFTTARFELALDPATGAIVELIDRETGRAWASGEHTLGLFRYQSFSEDDYNHFLDQYLASRPDWALLDLARPGVGAAGAVSGWWQPTLTGMWQKRSTASLNLILELSMPAKAVQLGAPRTAVLEIEIPEQSPTIQLTLQWFEKPASRLPEALWLSFRPLDGVPGSWQMEKLDQWISPLDVAPRAGRAMHGVNSGVVYQHSGDFLAIDTLDAAIVAPGEPRLLDYSDPIPDLTQGMHFNLFNNKWGTNHRAWFNEDARFRFALRFQ